MVKLKSLERPLVFHYSYSNPDSIEHPSWRITLPQLGFCLIPQGSSPVVESDNIDLERLFKIYRKTTKKSNVHLRDINKGSVYGGAVNLKHGLKINTYFKRLHTEEGERIFRLMFDMPTLEEGRAYKTRLRKNKDDPYNVASHIDFRYGKGFNRRNLDGEIKWNLSPEEREKFESVRKEYFGSVRKEYSELQGDTKEDKKNYFKNILDAVFLNF